MAFRSSIVAALIFILSVNTGSAQPSTKGTELWLAFMENLDLSMNGPPMFALYISSEFNTSGTITFPATGLNISYSVTSDQVTEVVLPTAILYSDGSNIIGNKGIKITANDAVSVYAIHYRSFFSDAATALPFTELGVEYLVLAGLDSYGNSPSEFVIISTADSNLIEITPSEITYGLNPADIPFSIILNAGETYQIQATSDLTGSTVKSLSNKKVAVFAGARQARIDCGSADNHLYDVNLPTTNWKMEYVIIPFKGQGGDRIKILASEDSTFVRFGCESDIVLNKGEYYDTLISSPIFINGDKPIAVAQYNQSQECNASNYGDPSMLILPPITYMAEDITFRVIHPTDGGGNGQYFDKQFINVITKTNSLSEFTLAGANIDTAFSVIPSKPAYSYAQIQLDTSVGDQRLYSDSGFYAYAYAFGYYDAYTYFLGYDREVQTSPMAFSLGNDTSVCLGTFTLDVTTPGATYLWQDNSTIATHNVAQQGTYWVAVILGCDTVSDTIEVSIISIPTSNAGLDTSICFGDSVQLIGSGGGTYIWTPQASLTDPNISNPWASPQQSGSYFLEVTDTNGCKDVDAVVIDIHITPVITQSDTTICLGDSVTLMTSGGVSFQWTPSVGLNNDTIANPTAYPSDTTMFIVMFIDSNGCTASDSVEIYPTPKPNLSITGQPSLCVGDSVTLTASGGVNYTWNTGELNASISVSPAMDTWYIVSATNMDCPKPSLDSVLVSAYPLPEAGAGPDVTVVLGSEITLSGTGGALYTWSPSSGLSCTNCQYPEASPSSDSWYYLTVTDFNGCLGYDSVFVAIDLTTSLYIPDVFSPNGDGENDYLYVQGKGIAHVQEFLIYDRWGEKVFESTIHEANNKSLGWNGEYQGKRLNSGVYVYTVTVQFHDGSEQSMQGDVTLVH